MSDDCPELEEHVNFSDVSSVSSDIDEKSPTGRSRGCQRPNSTWGQAEFVGFDGDSKDEADVECYQEPPIPDSESDREDGETSNLANEFSENLNIGTTAEVLGVQIATSTGGRYTYLET
eukprot:288903_1